MSWREGYVILGISGAFRNAHLDLYNYEAFTLLLMKAVALLDDLVDFARRQPMVVQKMVLSESVIIQHDGNATPAQSFCFHRASLTELHGGYAKVPKSFSAHLIEMMKAQRKKVAQARPSLALA